MRLTGLAFQLLLAFSIQTCSWVFWTSPIEWLWPAWHQTYLGSGEAARWVAEAWFMFGAYELVRAACANRQNPYERLLTCMVLAPFAPLLIKRQCS